MVRFGWIRLCGIAGLALAVICAGRSDADEIQWQADPGKGWKASSDTGRPMLIYATMEGCYHCKRMEQTTFADTQVQARVKEKFVPIHVEWDRHERLIGQWRINSFPTTLLVTPKGHVLARMTGYQAADELLRQANAALATSESPVEVAGTPTANKAR